MKRYESGWTKIVNKRKREEAAKVGARTLFDVGVAKKPKITPVSDQTSFITELNGSSSTSSQEESHLNLDQTPPSLKTSSPPILIKI